MNESGQRENPMTTIRALAADQQVDVETVHAFVDQLIGLDGTEAVVAADPGERDDVVLTSEAEQAIRRQLAEVEAS
jgi:hypothetical protein